jgi:hypothetical protein
MYALSTGKPTFCTPTTDPAAAERRVRLTAWQLACMARKARVPRFTTIATQNTKLRMRVEGAQRAAMKIWASHGVCDSPGKPPKEKWAARFEELFAAKERSVDALVHLFVCMFLDNIGNYMPSSYFSRRTVANKPDQYAQYIGVALTHADASASFAQTILAANTTWTPPEKVWAGYLDNFEGEQRCFSFVEPHAESFDMFYALRSLFGESALHTLHTIRNENPGKSMAQICADPEIVVRLTESRHAVANNMRMDLAAFAEADTTMHEVVVEPTERTPGEEGDNEAEPDPEIAVEGGGKIEIEVAVPEAGEAGPAISRAAKNRMWGDGQSTTDMDRPVKGNLNAFTAVALLHKRAVTLKENLIAAEMGAREPGSVISNKVVPTIIAADGSPASKLMELAHDHPDTAGEEQTGVGAVNGGFHSATRAENADGKIFETAIYEYACA